MASLLVFKLVLIHAARDSRQKARSYELVADVLSIRRVNTHGLAWADTVLAAWLTSAIADYTDQKGFLGIAPMRGTVLIKGVPTHVIVTKELIIGRGAYGRYEVDLLRVISRLVPNLDSDTH